MKVFLVLESIGKRTISILKLNDEILWKMASKLRVGLLLDLVFLPAWAYTAVERIVRSDSAELHLVILNQSRVKNGSSLAEVWQERDHWLYDVFNGIDEKIFLRGPNALTQVNSSENLLDVPVLQVKPVNENGGQHFSDSDVKQIKSYNLDILVKLGFGNLDGDVSSTATYGIWTYRWGEAGKVEDRLAGFWEVAEGRPETGVALQQLGPARIRYAF